VHEAADGIYRINPPVVLMGGAGFSFNQYLIVDDEPRLVLAGPRKMFPLVREAVTRLLPVGRLRYIGFSHVESDECGSLNEWLSVAPHSVPLCGAVAAMVSIEDLADRPLRALADGELLSLGAHRVRWFDAPHLPHAWECGFLTEESTRTLLCDDLFTQGGSNLPAITEADILFTQRRISAADGLLLAHPGTPFRTGGRMNPHSKAARHPRWLRHGPPFETAWFQRPTGRSGTLHRRRQNHLAAPPRGPCSHPDVFQVASLPASPAPGSL